MVRVPGSTSLKTFLGISQTQSTLRGTVMPPLSRDDIYKIAKKERSAKKQFCSADAHSAEHGTTISRNCHEGGTFLEFKPPPIASCAAFTAKGALSRLEPA